MIDQWLRGELKIPINVLFDQSLEPELGKLRPFDARINESYMHIYNKCNRIIRSKKDDYDKDLARMMIAELFKRGFRIGLTLALKQTKDPWMRECYKRSGLLTTKIFDKKNKIGHRISKL